MGVPAFYRWISEKYSKIVVDILEKRPGLFNGTVIPVDLQEPNPNQFEFDNLYIDMNGLIHPCSHPEDRDAPSTEEEMYINVTYYLDRLVAAVRPRNLLFLAIDGVAPRAKMNQQRSRRFRSAQEAKEKKEMKRKVLDEMVSLGYDTIDQEQDLDAWDSNVITPGTEFMTKISLFIRYYILEKMNRDPFWKNLKIIVSDASVPGEGEHKIMDFIRSQRLQPNYNPNLHHVIHGLDADLIMLALATHEMHFTILREKVFFGKQDKEREKSEAQKLFESQHMPYNVFQNPESDWVYNKPLEALHVFILRDYLENEFSVLKSTLPFQFDFERVIDDFIFLCFFVGNDFLPHLPSLDIRDGALDFLIECYKTVIPSLGNYLTSSGGRLNLLQIDVLLSKVGEIEDQIFLKRKVAEDNSERKFQDRKKFSRQERPNETISTAPSNSNNQEAAMKLKESLLGKRVRNESHELQNKSQRTESESLKTDEFEAENSDFIPKGSKTDDVQDLVSPGDEEAGEDEGLEADIAPLVKVIAKTASAEEIKKAQEELKTRLKNKEHELIESYKVSIKDHVKLHEAGWKERYYEEPFKKKDIEEGGGLQRMCYSYVQGLCWVFQYYFQGVPSWNWYYPFHYAPFASDLRNIDAYGEIEFEKSQPFSPIEQLLAVLPATSAAALPEECRWLMTDPSSPIIDLYDENIPIDPNGKHLPWLWILLLPFIDERRISAAFSMCKNALSPEAVKKNAIGRMILFVHVASPLGNFGVSQKLLDASSGSDSTALNFSDSGKLFGFLNFPPPEWHAAIHSVLFPPSHSERWFSRIDDNQVLSFDYMFPPVVGTHQSRVLPGVIRPRTFLTQHDLTLRRPPRLNKSGFNILDILGSYRDQQTHFHSSNSSSHHYSSNLPKAYSQSSQRSYSGRANEYSQPPHRAYSGRGGDNIGYNSTQAQHYQSYPPNYSNDRAYNQNNYAEDPRRSRSYPDAAPSVSMANHRIESLDSNPRRINHNVGRFSSSRPSKTVLISATPNVPLGGANRNPAGENSYQSNNFSFNRRSQQVSERQHSSEEVSSMQAMRDQLLQTINRKDKKY